MAQAVDYMRLLEDGAESPAAVAARTAAEVDRGAFPKAVCDALAKSGLMGLISSTEAGGMGQGPRAAVAVVERLARECGSSAMVACMHYAAVQVIEKYGSMPVRREVAAGKHLCTLAFSEAGSRSQFWAPTSTAKAVSGGVQLDAKKSWVTSATHATLYVWSSKPQAAEGMSTIWLVPRGATGVKASGDFNGLGLRGNDSRPMAAEKAVIPASSRLAEDGAGLGVMLEVVLPIFNLMTSAVAVGLMEGAIGRAIAHISGVKFEHTQSTLADLPTIRAYAARMRILADMARALLMDTVAAIEGGRPDTMLRVLECKAAAGEAALQVMDHAMRICGGAAFRGDVAVDRYFRDSRAASVMAPTTDHLYDFIGKALCGLPVF